MANHRSAEKRIRQNIKRRASNKNARSAIRTNIKGALQAANSGNFEHAYTRAGKAMSLLDKAVAHGVHHKKNAQRRISRLYKNIESQKASN